MLIFARPPPSDPAPEFEHGLNLGSNPTPPVPCSEEQTRLCEPSSKLHGLQKNDAKKDLCWNCGKAGHYASECPKPHQKGDPKGKSLGKDGKGKAKSKGPGKETDGPDPKPKPKPSLLPEPGRLKTVLASR